MPSVLDEHLQKHRRRLIEREEAAVRELLAEYERLEKTLRREIRELKKKIKAAEAAGETISPSWFYREKRLESFLDQVKTEMLRYGRSATAVTTREQAAAVQLAIDQARQTVNVIAGEGRVGMLMNPSAIANAIGMMGDGSPIASYYEETLAPRVVAAMRREIIEAAAVGTPFNTIVNRLLKTGDITRSRALMVARTEVNRVRREMTRQFYLANKDVFTGWEWVASKSARTCPACLAMDGTIHKLTEPFPQHINCRCTMMPVLDGVTRPKRTIGEEWFKEQPDDVKREILGVSAFDAYERGELSLKDMVGWATDKRFGKRVYTKPFSVLSAK